ELGETRPAGVRLDVAEPTAATARPVEADRHVAELAGEAIGAVEEPAAGHDRAADAGRDRQVDEVVVALRGAERPLAEGRDVRVPVEERRQVERLGRGRG